MVSVQDSQPRLSVCVQQFCCLVGIAHPISYHSHTMACHLRTSSLRLRQASPSLSRACTLLQGRVTSRPQRSSLLLLGGLMCERAEVRGLAATWDYSTPATEPVPKHAPCVTGRKQQPPCRAWRCHISGCCRAACLLKMYNRLHAWCNGNMWDPPAGVM